MYDYSNKPQKFYEWEEPDVVHVVYQVTFPEGSPYIRWPNQARKMVEHLESRYPVLFDRALDAHQPRIVEGGFRMYVFKLTRASNLLDYMREHYIASFRRVDLHLAELVEE